MFTPDEILAKWYDREEQYTKRSPKAMLQQWLKECEWPAEDPSLLKRFEKSIAEGVFLWWREQMSHQEIIAEGPGEIVITFGDAHDADALPFDTSAFVTIEQIVEAVLEETGDSEGREAWRLSFLKAAKALEVK